MLPALHFLFHQFYKLEVTAAVLFVFRFAAYS